MAIQIKRLIKEYKQKYPDKKMSKRILAEKAGCSAQWLTNLEVNDTPKIIRVLKVISKELKVPINKLLENK